MQASHKLAEEMYKQKAGPEAAGGPQAEPKAESTSGTSQADSDGAVEADYEVVDEKDKK